jgi:hypothetical protein
MSALPNITAACTITQLCTLGNANSNGVSLDLQGYKGPVTFVLTVGQSSVGAGTLNVANIQTFTADTAASYADVTGGNFTPVVDSSNASNVSVQSKTFDVRNLSRWVRVPTQVSGTNCNIPLSIVAIGQKERV